MQPCFKGRTTNSRDDWETPAYFYRLLDNEFHFTLDPCASSTNHKCGKYYTLLDNGLLKNWAGETVFVNPPFSHKDIWIRKCYQESLKPNITVVLIIPSTTDTKAWHSYVMQADEVRFCAGRVNFLDPTAGQRRNGATFPLVVVVFRARQQGYLKTISFQHK